MTVEPDFGTVALAVLAGYLMVAAGLRKRQLRWRRSQRVCPSCRHASADCRCGPARRRSRLRAG